MPKHNDYLKGLMTNHLILLEKQNLEDALQSVSQTCINCKFCKRECAFLQKYGKPKEIADSYEESNHPCRTMPFECSLCQLCEAVCPVNVKPVEMFLQMRRAAAAHHQGLHARHGTLLDYERRGTSRWYSYYALPAQCNTVLFPGCALAGAQPNTILRLFEHLQKCFPALGIVLDCCTKPSHDLGRRQYFAAMFGEMLQFLTKNGVQRILVACPSCYRTFKDYGSPLEVQTVYEVLAAGLLTGIEPASGVVCVHDPCATRYEPEIHEASRQLISAAGFTIKQMPHEREETLCCGEGGAVGFVNHDLAEHWAERRAREAKGQRIITYCSGCVSFLGKINPTSHLLDVVFESKAVMNGSIMVSKPPFTYLNRIRLKNYFRRNLAATVTRERTFSPDESDSRLSRMKRSIPYL